MAQQAILPLDISTWGSKSSLHRDTRISAKNRIRMLLAIARNNYCSVKCLDAMSMNKTCVAHDACLNIPIYSKFNTF